MMMQMHTDFFHSVKRITLLACFIMVAVLFQLKIYPIHRGYIPPFYIIVYLCLGRNPCMSRDVLGGVTLSPTQDCHLMCFFGPTSRLDYSPSNGLLTQSAPSEATLPFTYIRASYRESPSASPALPQTTILPA